MIPLREAIEKTIRAYRDTDPELATWLTESLEKFDREQAMRKEMEASGEKL